MTARTLLFIVLKIFGLFLIKDLIVVLFQVVTFIFYFSNEESNTSFFGSLLVTVAYLAAYGLGAYFLIFKTKTIFDYLKLDQDLTEEQVALEGMKTAPVLTLALIIIGGVILVMEVPIILRELWILIVDKAYEMGYSWSSIILSSVKIIIAIVLIEKHKPIVNFIERKQDKPSS